MILELIGHLVVKCVSKSLLIMKSKQVKHKTKQIVLRIQSTENEVFHCANILDVKTEILKGGRANKHEPIGNSEEIEAFKKKKRGKKTVCR